MVIIEANDKRIRYRTSNPCMEAYLSHTAVTRRHAFQRLVALGPSARDFNCILRRSWCTNRCTLFCHGTCEAVLNSRTGSTRSRRQCIAATPCIVAVTTSQDRSCSGMGPLPHSFSRRGRKGTFRNPGIRLCIQLLQFERVSILREAISLIVDSG